MNLWGPLPKKRRLISSFCKSIFVYFHWCCSENPDCITYKEKQTLINTQLSFLEWNTKWKLTRCRLLFIRAWSLCFGLCAWTSLCCLTMYIHKIQFGATARLFIYKRQQESMTHRGSFSVIAAVCVSQVCATNQFFMIFKLIKTHPLLRETERGGTLM